MNETEVIITVHNLLFYEVLLLYPVTDVVTLFTYTPMPFCGHCGSSVTADLQCVECLRTVVSGGDIITVSPQFYSKVFYSIINNMRKRKYYSSYPNYMIFSYKLLRGIFLYTPFNKEVPVPFTITNSLYRKKDIFNKKGSKRLYKKRHRFKVSVN